MKTKSCFKCGIIKPLDQFYRHPAMSDGHLGKCIPCAKKDTQDRYESKEGRRKVLEYEKRRFQNPERRAKVIEYQKMHRARDPQKYRARSAVGNAIRDGKLAREPCEICGDERAQAHHDDYSKPLDVRWLCFKHHREIGHGQKVGP
jgi:hypothetical protein